MSTVTHLAGFSPKGVIVKSATVNLHDTFGSLVHAAIMRLITQHFDWLIYKTLIITPGNKVNIQSSMSIGPLTSHHLGSYCKMQSIHITWSTWIPVMMMMIHAKSKRLERWAWAQKKQPWSPRILSASCLQLDQESGPHTSVYFSAASETRLLVPSVTLHGKN